MEATKNVTRIAKRVYKYHEYKQYRNIYICTCILTSKSIVLVSTSKKQKFYWKTIATQLWNTTKYINKVSVFICGLKAMKYKIKQNLKCIIRPVDSISLRYMFCPNWQKQFKLKSLLTFWVEIHKLTCIWKCKGHKGTKISLKKN